MVDLLVACGRNEFGPRCTEVDLICVRTGACMPPTKAHGASGETMKTLRFGIEIETVGLGLKKLATVIQGVVGGTATFDGRGWQVTDAHGRVWNAVPDA